MTFLGGLVTNGVQLVQLALLAHLLPPEDFGLMAMTLVVVGVVQTYADLGLSNALLHFREPSEQQLSTLYWIGVATGLVLYALSVAVAPAFEYVIGAPQFGDLLRLAALSLIFAGISQQFQVLLQKALRFGPLAAIEAVSASVNLVTSLWFAQAGKGALALILGYLAQHAVKSFLLVILGIRWWRPRVCFVPAEVKPYLRFGLYQIGERSVNYLAWNLDKALIGPVLGTEALGYYHVAYQLVTKPFMALNPLVTKVALPILAKLQTDNRTLSQAYLEVVQAVEMTLFPVYAGFVVMAEPLVLLLLGEDWISAVPLIQVLSLLGFSYAIGNPLGTLLVAKGRPDIGLFITTSGLVLYATAIALGFKAGLLGVAWALVIAQWLVMFPLEFWVRHRLVSMGPREFLTRIAPVFVVTLAAGGIAYASAYVTPAAAGPLLQLVMQGLAGACAYATLIWMAQRSEVARLWSSLSG